MKASISEANQKVEQVRQILINYAKNAGCVNMSMAELRDAFAKIYNPATPDFHYHFSTLARIAITEDIRRGRKGYPIGGVIPADYDIMVGDPVILPGKAIFYDSREALHRAMAKDTSTLGDSEIRRSQNISLDELKPTDSHFLNPSSSFDPTSALSDRISPAGEIYDERSHVGKGKEPELRSHPRFSPPHNDAFARHVKFVQRAAAAQRGNSNTPPGSPPISLRQVDARARPPSPPLQRVEDNSNTERSQEKINDQPSNSSLKRDSRSGLDKTNPIRKDRSELPQPSSSKKKIGTDSDDSSVEISSIHHKKNKRRTREKSVDLDSDSSDSNDQSTTAKNLIPQPQVNFVAKVKQEYAFQKNAKSHCLENYSKGARRLQEVVVQHLSDIKQAANAFNTCGVKPTDFPAELTRDLLAYNFIHIELIYAYNLQQKSKTHLYDSDDKSSGSHKVKPVPVNHYGHWSKIMDTLQDTYVAAFPIIQNHFHDYFDDLLSLTKGFSEPAEWDTIRD